MNAFIQLVGAVIITILMVVLLGLVLSYPMMLLWNGCLVGAVTGIQSIGLLQAWGILMLCGFLFKSTSQNKSE